MNAGVLEPVLVAHQEIAGCDAMGARHKDHNIGRLDLDDWCEARKHEYYECDESSRVPAHSSLFSEPDLKFMDLNHANSASPAVLSRARHSEVAGARSPDTATALTR